MSRERMTYDAPVEILLNKSEVEKGPAQGCDPLHPIARSSQNAYGGQINHQNV